MISALLVAAVLSQPTATLVWSADAERPWPGDGDPGRCFVNAEHRLPPQCDWLYWDAGDSYRETCADAAAPEFWCRSTFAPISGSRSYYAHASAPRTAPAKQGYEHRAYPFGAVRVDGPFVLSWMQAIRADFSKWPNQPGAHWATLMGLSSNPCCGAIEPSHSIGFDPNGLWADGWQRGPGGVPPQNVPFRLTVAVDPGSRTYRLWMAGELVIAGAWTATAGLRQFHPGLYAASGVADFHSQMDDFRLWSLSAPWGSDAEPRYDQPTTPEPTPTPEPAPTPTPEPEPTPADGTCVRVIPIRCPD